MGAYVCNQLGCSLISVAIPTRMESMEVHGMHTGNRKREFHGIHGSGTRNWNLDTHEIHGIHDFHGILLKFHGVPLDSLDVHGIP